MKRIILQSLCKIIFFLCLFSSTSYSSMNDPSDINDQQIILNKINAYRSTKRLEPLKLNQIISETATQHSNEMAEKKISFGHKGFNQRMQAIFAHVQQSNAIAENVVFTSSGAEDAVRLWLNSTGHRKNIEGNYNLTGIGIAHDKNGFLYVTQIFVYSNSAHCENKDD